MWCFKDMTDPRKALRKVLVKKNKGMWVSLLTRSVVWEKLVNLSKWSGDHVYLTGLK